VSARFQVASIHRHFLIDILSGEIVITNFPADARLEAVAFDFYSDSLCLRIHSSRFEQVELGRPARTFMCEYATKEKTKDNATKKASIEETRDEAEASADTVSSAAGS